MRLTEGLRVTRAFRFAGSWIARLRSAFAEAVRGRHGDLQLTAWTETAFLAAGTMVAKWMIVSFAFGEASYGRRIWLTAKVTPVDLLVIGGVACLSLLLGRVVRVPERWRWPAVIAVIGADQLLLFATFANVEFFGSWGSPLTFDLLRLGPHLAAYIFVVGVSNVTGTMTVWALVAATGLVGVPLLQGRLASVWRTRTGRVIVGSLSGVALLGGACLLAVPPHEHREATLRDLNLLSVFVPGWREPHDTASAPLSAKDEAALLRLCGPTQDNAPVALAPLRGRRLNVVLWVWESVSARHLASFHRLGRALTPNLDRMMAVGSVSFSDAYAECPITVQTTWALLTGLRPPAMPFVFVENGPLPAHGPTLQGELSRAGYRTAAFVASYAHMWNARRVFDLEPFDAFEDADTLAGKGSYAVSGIGIQDDAIVERSLDWISSGPRSKPFFALLWNTETHRPYTWVGMPPQTRALRDYERFLTVVERGDELLGRLHSGLAERGLLDDTIVIVLGDHGEAFGRGSRPWHWGHASQVFEDEVHVPFVFIHPSLTVSTAPRLCTHADLFPTLMDLLGRRIPPGLAGRSLASRATPEPLFMRATRWWPLAIRAGDYKLILPELDVPPLLYDIRSDPEEGKDLTDAQPELARLLNSALLRWHSARFRTDPTFGYKMPTIQRLFGRPPTIPSDRWDTGPASAPSPGK
jgi:arylsulfatase A-like enzyme